MRRNADSGQDWLQPGPGCSRGIHIGIPKELMNCGDLRVEDMAATWIYEWALGKPKEMLLQITRIGVVRPADDDARAVRHVDRETIDGGDDACKETRGDR